MIEKAKEVVRVVLQKEENMLTAAVKEVILSRGLCNIGRF